MLIVTKELKDKINFEISRRNLQIYIGKLILIVLLAIVFAVLMSNDEQSDFQKGKKLTYEEYVSNYSNYKHELMSEPLGVWFTIIIFIIFLVAFFLIYELLGALLGKYISKLKSTRTTELDYFEE